MPWNGNKLGGHEISKDAASLSGDEEVKIIFSLRTTIANLQLQINWPEVDYYRRTFRTRQ